MRAGCERPAPSVPLEAHTLEGVDDSASEKQDHLFWACV